MVFLYTKVFIVLNEVFKIESVLLYTVFCSYEHL